jgi:hypothetical protein
MQSAWRGGFVVSTPSSHSQPEFRLLLDQGFPKPTGFVIAELDQSVALSHLSDFAPDLAQRSTPDWYIYCAAAEGGFDALVVRDRSQLDQLAEMYVLSRLPTLSIVTWRKGIDDPVREWGQLLAYLPDVKRRCLEKGGRGQLSRSHRDHRPRGTGSQALDPSNSHRGQSRDLGLVGAVGAAARSVRPVASPPLIATSERRKRRSCWRSNHVATFGRNGGLSGVRTILKKTV